MLDSSVVVVGAGPGGCITGTLLAEAGHDVLMLDAGEFIRQSEIEKFSLEQMERQYMNGGVSAAFGKPTVQFVEGRGVGGGSEVNSGLYHRLPEDVRARWENEFAIKGFSKAEMEKHYEAIEKDVSVSYMPEGTIPAASLKLDQGAKALGWHAREVPRWHAYGEGLPAEGVRQSMTETFVPRFVEAGGKLLCNATVDGIRKEKDRWFLCVSVQDERGIVKRVDITAKTVFLSCGAVRTPYLLKKSGIRLQSKVGLQLHPSIKVVAEFDEEVNGLDMSVPVHQVKEFAPEISMGCSISTPWYLAAAMQNVENGMREVEEKWKRMASYYAMTATDDSGSITALPGFKDPVVRYKVSPKAMANLGEGLRRLCELLFKAGAVRLYPSVEGMPPLESESDIERIPRKLPPGKTGLMTIHLTSSMPMGEGPKCNVDSYGKLKGHDGLYIADASLLCSAPGVNPQGTLMAMVRRNALKWLNNKG